jgi:hypothetical protein
VSTAVSILAAQVPDKPTAPATALSGSDVIVTWTNDYSGDSPITSYEIMFEYSDGTTYGQYKPTCDGTDANIVASLTCTVDSAVLNQPPFNLVWGASVYAKITAFNIKGSSI